MRLTTKGRYAVTAMLDLALHARHEPVSLADISDRQSISVSYLEQLFAKLRKQGLVSSVPRSLMRWMSQLTLRAVVARVIASRA
jgi:Rrf2 family protein